MNPKNPKSIRNERYDAPEHFEYPYVPNKGHMLILQPQTSQKTSKNAISSVPGREVLFGGQNFKSAKQGQSVQKSRKSRFRDNTFYRGRIRQRIVSEPQKNVLRMYYGCFDHFLTAVQSILMPKSCFLTILEGLNVSGGCTGAQEPKKVKIAKNELK